STSSPYWVGQVWKFKTHDEYAAFIAQRAPTAVGKIPGYSIAVMFVGALGKYRLPTTEPEANALARVFREMADTYYECRIEPNKG
ncbi:hypothetical protein LXA15_17620, partial [Erwinia amylovora]|uniref:hypothetical protein n=1 Tax=Erwinia amylovora TaxID=552 RepID=UPI0020BD556A